MGDNYRKNRKRILFLTNIPSPYRIDFFNELGKFCDLTVIFEKSKSEERDSSWNEYVFNSFCGIVLSGLTVDKDKAISIKIINYLNKDYDHIIVTNAFTPTGLIAVFYMFYKKISYSVEGDGAFLEKDLFLTRIIKCFVIKHADKYYSTSYMHDKYYINYGANPINIIRYPFTSLYKKDLLLKIKNRNEKEEYRKELGIYEDRVIISVGQIIKRKGFDVLLNAMKSMPENCGLYIIGGEPTKDLLDIIASNKLVNIHFQKYQRNDILKKYYYASDIFVLATREDIWGLVVNEAMAAGLPVITTKKCIAGLELVENGYNGYLFDVDDKEKLRKLLLDALFDDYILETMGKNSLSKIQDYTIEKMVQAHLESFEGDHL